MNPATVVAIGAVVVAAIIGLIFYQSQQRAAEREAYSRTLGGGISTILSGVGSTIGAAVNMGASGSSGS
jgi:hypothetical protein